MIRENNFGVNNLKKKTFKLNKKKKKIKRVIEQR